MFNKNINQLAEGNNNFRQVIYTGPKSQLVLMSLLPGEDIGEEVHPDTDQILFFVSGSGQATLNDQVTAVAPGSAVFVPAGTTHNFKNIGTEALKLYTIYAPAEHADGTIHVTKAEAQHEHD